MLRKIANQLQIVPRRIRVYFNAHNNGSHSNIHNPWPKYQEAVKDYQYELDYSVETKKSYDDNSLYSITNRNVNKRLFSEYKTDSKKLAFASDVFAEAPIVYTDGACSNNGKSYAAAGIGIWWGDNHSDNISAPVSGTPTCNRAEYEGILTAMKQARQKGFKVLKICTDSKLLISSMDKWLKKWKENGWKTAKGGNVRNRDLLQAIDDVREDVAVQFLHVKKRSEIYGNKMADVLARKGAKKFVA